MTRFDIEEFIDRTPIGVTQSITLIVCAMVCFIDGFDLVLLGKIAPAIAKHFGETSAAMTPAFVYQQVGLAVGAFVISPLADRIGRRLMLIIACLFLGIIMLASTQVQSLHMLAVMRGLAGIFMAAGLPMAMALVSELTPLRRRSTFVAVALAGYSMGSAASGIVAAWLLDDFGWQSGFLIGGAVPLVCLPLLLFFVPESLKFCAERNPADVRIAGTVRRLDPNESLRGDEIFVLGSANSKGRRARLVDIFSEGRLTTTALIWAASTLSVTNTVVLGTWLPSFFQEMAGVPIQKFAVVALIGYLGGVGGPLIVGWLMDKTRPALLLASFYVMLAISLNMLAWVPFGTPAFIVVVVCWAFFQSGGSGGINTMMTHIYPPRMRSTALGWAGGAARVGAVIAPIAGGFALAQQFSLKLTLALEAILPLGVALLMLALATVRRESAMITADPEPEGA
ncbi:MFS transporter [Sphingobium nicotianae]|uniref:MFS transporter n=1 Tax=Sphingobium nicotianae TaxID=2782607 RepID=A0A9X1IQ36_9SPHN|nr:MFS transporter [Sphingobium nicotianae]MBT2186331.1 MFS transporter [Sphingobium nicotianae]